MCVINIEMTDKIPAVGSKAQVFHSAAHHTSGGLKKKDLMKTKKGRIVSRRKHAQGLKAIKRLFALGYKPKKGTFKVMRKSMVDGRRTKGRSRSRRSRTRRGGASAPGVPDVTATGHKAQ
jgi:hypothetical protein